MSVELHFISRSISVGLSLTPTLLLPSFPLDYTTNTHITIIAFIVRIVYVALFLGCDVRQEQVRI